MTKIAIVNHHSRLNRGTAAILNTRIKALKDQIPDAEFTVFTYNMDTDYAPELKDMPGIKIKFYDPILWIRKSPSWIAKTGLNLVKLAFYRSNFVHWNKNKNGIREYLDADLIVSTGGDVLTEDYGVRVFRNQCINLLIGVWFGKPIVIYGETIGPFKNALDVKMIRHLLNHSRLITLREEISAGIVKEIGITNVPTYTTADSAFLLEPANEDRIQRLLEIEGIRSRDTPLVGISASKVISRFGFRNAATREEKYRQYIEIMARMVDYLTEKLNSRVVFIPHVTEYWSSDDRKVAADIIASVKNPQKCVNITSDYTAAELKGIIGTLDMFIGTRMHSTIASTSMYVPTVIIAYSHKAHGIMGKALSLDQYVVDIRSIEYEALTARIDDVWKNKDTIRADLKNKIPVIKERAQYNAVLVKNLIQERGRPVNIKKE